MATLIFRTTARYLLLLLLLYSVYLLMRGHNEPGGGFAGGLVAAAAFALYSIAYGSLAARRALFVEPRLLIGLGLLIAVLSGLIGVTDGQPFLTGVWGYLELMELGQVDVGTPVLFDIGVYLVVVGVTLTIVFAMEEVD